MKRYKPPAFSIAIVCGYRYYTLRRTWYWRLTSSDYKVSAFGSPHCTRSKARGEAVRIFGKRWSIRT